MFEVGDIVCLKWGSTNAYIAVVTKVVDHLVTCNWFDSDVNIGSVDYDESKLTKAPPNHPLYPSIMEYFGSLDLWL